MESEDQGGDDGITVRKDSEEDDLSERAHGHQSAKSESIFDDGLWRTLVSNVPKAVGELLTSLCGGVPSGRCLVGLRMGRKFGFSRVSPILRVVDVDSLVYAMYIRK